MHGVRRALGPLAGVAAAIYVRDLGWTPPGVVLAFLAGHAVVAVGLLLVSAVDGWKRRQDRTC